jgi:hypothetical protein
MFQRIKDYLLGEIASLLECAAASAALAQQFARFFRDNTCRLKL